MTESSEARLFALPADQLPRTPSEKREKWLWQRKAERKAFIDEYKVTAGCVDCGYRDNPVALDFDHVRGEKLFSIGQRFHVMSDEKILDEIAKCEVRCANCHRIKTWLERSGG
jgi:hypothetical protein